MKKLLLTSAAVAAASLAVSPAYAKDGGVKLGVSGVYKGYVAYLDQDSAPGTDERAIDILREDELRFSGSTTLDNGLTVGGYFEYDLQGDTRSANNVEEAYAFLSGGWGRINLGEEDNAAFLLQVGAPSADGNLDGLRNSIDPVNYSVARGTLTRNLRSNAGRGFLFDQDYDMDAADRQTGITYLTPVFSGFQAGVSYIPEVAAEANQTQAFGVNQDDQTGDLGEAYSIAARYQGKFEDVGVNLGVGFTQVQEEDNGTFTTDVLGTADVDGDGTNETAETDDRTAWNVGLDINWKAFGLGAAYQEDDWGVDDSNNNDAERQTYVIGADYTHGPFKFGATYYKKDQELEFLTSTDGELETTRYTGGVIYTYGPGMTFRGSVSYTEIEEPGDLTGALAGTSKDTEAVGVLVGTQINF